MSPEGKRAPPGRAGQAQQGFVRGKNRLLRAMEDCGETPAAAVDQSQRGTGGRRTGRSRAGWCLQGRVRCSGWRQMSQGPERWPGFLLGPPGTRGRMEGGAPGHTPEREPRTFLPPGPGSSASERPALSRAALFSLGPAGEAGEQGGRGSAAKVQPQALLGEGTDSAAGQGPCGALPGATARVWAGEVLLSEGTASLLSSEPGREGRSLGPLQAAGGCRL